ncbi:hypothetical protein BDV96DRAFT_640028 [Lophiotrema nucula]|uniref:Uncharacterized protein n=1 Tax=Lophiotrema nucula TaxID=690887 RepID=A0A6A5ZS93_9PLEO|nr:hypothetical protein BDV96DRAFT_640028 [Lophiotrema nucula]
MNRKPSFGLLTLAKSTSQPDKSSTTSQPPDNGPKSAREFGTADKSGWRKKFHAGRPKTPLPVNVAEEEGKVTDDTARRPQAEKSGWKKTIQGSRAVTPIATALSATAEEDGDDSRIEQGSELSTLHRRSDPPRPSSKRHWSSYIAITGPKEHIFSEPWSLDSPLLLEPPVDPFMVLQSVRSHISKLPTEPIPVQHHSGILRVFEDYRKVRAKKENIEDLLNVTLGDFKRAEESWTASEDQYKAEIRRLELLIARGTSGMAGLMRARQDSVIKRTRRHTAYASNASETVPEFLSRGQLRHSFESREEQLSLHRPSSPSETMASISRKFASSSLDELPIGTPPSSEREITLSRKVKSELNLSKMANFGTSNPDSQSTYSDFSASGDQLPDERGNAMTQSTQPSTGHEKADDLHDLLSRVALQHGVDTEALLSHLVGVLASLDHLNPVIDTENRMEKDDDLVVARRRASDPTRRQLNSVTMGRRHFSFEPGDDQLTEENLRNLHMSGSPEIPPMPRLPQFVDSSSDSLSDESVGGHVDAAPNRPSKIPSPIQGPLSGHAKREVSASSLQTVSGRPLLEDDQRRDSSHSADAPLCVEHWLEGMAARQHRRMPAMQYSVTALLEAVTRFHAPAALMNSFITDTSRRRRHSNDEMPPQLSKQQTVLHGSGKAPVSKLLNLGSNATTNKSAV